MAAILITDVDDNNNLVMDGGNASTDRKSTVTWNVVTPKVASIQITLPTTPGIWDPKKLPNQLGQSINWQGTVGDVQGEEDYNISHVNVDGRTGSHDPKVIVNP